MGENANEPPLQPLPEKYTGMFDCTRHPSEARPIDRSGFVDATFVDESFFGPDADWSGEGWCPDCARREYGIGAGPEDAVPAPTHKPRVATTHKPR